MFAREFKSKFLPFALLILITSLVLPGTLSNANAVLAEGTSLNGVYESLLSGVSSSRPGLVQGIMASAPEITGKFITLSWNPNPKSDNVDRYAVYVSDMTARVEKQGGGLVGYSKVPYVKFPVARDGYRGEKGDGVFRGTRGDTYAIWVVAHNAHGWGKNDGNTANPDTYFSKRPDLSSNINPPYPKFVMVIFR